MRRIDRYLSRPPGNRCLWCGGKIVLAPGDSPPQLIGSYPCAGREDLKQVRVQGPIHAECLEDLEFNVP